MRQLVIIGIAMFSCQLSFSQLQKGVPVVASKDAPRVSTKIHFFDWRKFKTVIAAQAKIALPVLKNTLLFYDLSTQGRKQYKLIIK